MIGNCLYKPGQFLSFIQQIFIEHLLYTKYCTKCLGYKINIKQKRHSPLNVKKFKELQHEHAGHH